MWPIEHELLDPEFLMDLKYSDRQGLDHKDKRRGRGGAGKDPRTPRGCRPLLTPLEPRSAQGPRSLEPRETGVPMGRQRDLVESVAKEPSGPRLFLHLKGPSNGPSPRPARGGAPH